MAWSKIIKEKDRGGLGVGSLKATNTALLAKWLSRFKANNSSLWVRVISSIHRGFHKWESVPAKHSLGGSWKQICQVDKENNNGNSRMMERLKVKFGQRG